jgi:hypothetical protein
MALKDLIAEKGALDEAAIERIVGPYVRYDTEAREIHFMPAFAGLSNKAKILVYLVALQGWRFVTDEAMPIDARPSDIEAVTGIPGGSLRPVLRGLSESHHLSENDSRYSVRSTSLAAVEGELSGGGGDGVVVRRRAGSRKATRSKVRTPDASDLHDDEGVEGEEDEQADEIAVEESGVAATAKRPRKVAGKTGNLAATFERWIDEGYFDEPRTMADVQKRFRKEAIMVPRTSLPGYFLGAVRKGRLTRDEVEANGKTVWAYSTGANVKTKGTT